MTTEQNPADRYLELCMRRVRAWEQSAPMSRTEREQAEAFTRAFAELNAVLKDGGTLPRAWAGAQLPGQEEDGTGISPVRELLGAHDVRLAHAPGEDSGL